MKKRKHQNKKNVGVGYEPDSDQITIKSKTDINLILCLNWYNYCHTQEDAKNWLIKWMNDSGYSIEDVNKIKEIDQKFVPLHLGALGRMMMRGFELPVDLVGSLKSSINLLVDTHEQRIKRSSVAVVDRTHQKINNAIIIIETEIDEFYKSNYSSSFKSKIYEFLRVENIRGYQAQTIYSYYKPLWDEVRLITFDDGVKEGYARLSTQQILSYQNYMKTLMNDIQRHIHNQEIVKVRKPRIKKIKPIIQNIDQVKYLKEDKDLKVASANPSTIFGAESVWIYNTKYKKLTQLVAESDKGLSIRGTTIYGYSEKESKSKTLRKPEIIIPQVLEFKKPQLKNLFSQLTTKDSPLTGRLGEETLILRVIKK